MVIKYHRGTVIITIILLLTLTQGILESHVDSRFSYLDEVLAVAFGLYIFFNWIRRKRVTDPKDRVMTRCLILIGAVGILGNLIIGAQSSYQAVALDIIATFKNFIILFGIGYMYKNGDVNKYTIHFVAVLCRLYVYVLSALAIINLFADIGMGEESEYGIRAFKFVYGGSGNYSLWMYSVAFIILIDIAIAGKMKRSDVFAVFAVVWAWSASLVTRAIVYSLLLIAIYIIIRFSSANRLKWYHFVPLAAIVAYEGYSEIIFYFFSGEDTARKTLYQYGWKTMTRFFPIGAGFGSFGSDTAHTYWSDLYTEYGFNNIFGLSNRWAANHSNDNFWPEIMGQFGFIGLILFVIIIIAFYRKFMRLSLNRLEQFVIQWIMLVFLIGSSGTKTYIHFTMVPIFITLALFENIVKDREKNKLQNAPPPNVYMDKDEVAEVMLNDKNRGQK